MPECLQEPKPSPYLYDEHALIYYCNDLPHPTKEREEFIQQGVERLIQLLEISHGMALVLFTAKTDMEDVYAALQGRDLPYKILIQQSGASQEKVLREFRGRKFRTPGHRRLLGGSASKVKASPM